MASKKKSELFRTEVMDSSGGFVEGSGDFYDIDEAALWACEQREKSSEIATYRIFKCVESGGFEINVSPD